MATANSSSNDRGSALELVGQVLDGRYRIVRRIGAGGMGAVYEARHVSLRTRVAVKVLKEELAADETHRLRFLREARAATAIASDHVVQITDFGVADGGVAYFVMEYLEGSDLQRLAKAEGRLPWPRARHILLQIATALGAAHEEGIVHRDIKPANVLVFDDPKRNLYDFVKVLDFGIAKVNFADDELNGLTATGEAFGTPAYMAPELTVGEPATPASDIYAFGILAYRILTGHLPFKGANPYQVLACHRLETPVAPRELEPSVPPAAEQIILRCLAKQAADRFGYVAEVEAALQSIPVDSTAQTFALTLELKRTTVPPAAATATAEQPTPATENIETPSRIASGGSTTPPTASVRRNALVITFITLIGILAAVTTAWLVVEYSTESPPRAADAATVPPTDALPPDRSGSEDIGETRKAGTAGSDSTGSDSNLSTGGTQDAGTTAHSSPAPPIEPPTKPAHSASSTRKKAQTDSTIVSRLKRRLPSTCATHGAQYDILVFIRPKGKVVDVDIKGGDTSKHACLDKALRKQAFPRGEGRTIPIRI